VTVTNDSLVVDLKDGRAVSAPLAWYPRLLHGTPEERDNWRLIGGGEGIHWPDLDEDLSIESLISGRPSGESQASLKRWLETRKAHTKRAQQAGGTSGSRVGRLAKNGSGERRPFPHLSPHPYARKTLSAERPGGKTGRRLYEGALEKR